MIGIALPHERTIRAQSGCSLDLLLVLDGSGSIHPGDFETMKNSVYDLANSFTIDPADANIGIIQFSNTASGNWDIWIINADGTDLQQWTNDPGRDWLADWAVRPCGVDPC